MPLFTPGNRQQSVFYPLKRQPLGERLLSFVERQVKGPLFGCRMCGNCLLQETAFICPMACPKGLRNGPCGGVQLDGKCETDPEMDCVWLKALERLAKTPYDGESLRLNPPVDWQLEEMASWVTLVLGRDQISTGSDEQPRYASEVMD